MIIFLPSIKPYRCMDEYFYIDPDPEVIKKDWSLQKKVRHWNNKNKKGCDFFQKTVDIVSAMLYYDDQREVPVLHILM